MNAATRLRKLRTMSATEVRARLAAAAYRVYERRSVRTAAALGTTSRHDSILTATGQSPLPAFLPSVDDLDVTRRLLVDAYASESQASIARADLVLEGKVSLFGRVHSFGEAFDWHADPVSGKRWPLLYHADVPVGDRRTAPGDAKDVWELNRQQFLLDVAKAWLLTGRHEYARTVDRIVRSWIAENPYGMGVNWSGPLEVAYRALSWIWAYRLLGDYLRADGTTHKIWIEGLNDHGRFLYRHLELFESPFNHLVGESAVLFILGVLFPGFAEASRWRHRGHQALESRLADQFYPDGGSVEQAVVYHHATLGFYLLAALVAKANRQEFSREVWAAIERAIDFSLCLTQPDGRQPALGDNDDARPVAFDRHDVWDFRFLQAAGAVLFNRPDFKFVAGRFPEDAFWLLGPSGASRFAETPAVAPRYRSAVRRASGYVVLRSGWDRSDDYVCFDCGQQAGGLRVDAIPSAAHGHADALAIVAHLGGQPLLVDAGFLTYDGERAWERHFRETAAHNTIRVDGSDQAVHLEKMAWAHVPRVSLEGAGIEEGHSWATASHDGYARSAGGIVHRRTVWLRPTGYLVLFDELTGDGTHSAEAIFQFAEGAQTSLAGNRLLVADRFIVSWSGTSELHPAIRIGGSAPDDGWIAPRLGRRVAAARLVLEASFSGTLGLLTVIADGTRWSIEGTVKSDDGRCLVQRLTRHNLTEIVLASTGHGVASTPIDSPQPYETDATVGVWRLDEGSVVEATRIGGTFIRPERRDTSA